MGKTLYILVSLLISAVFTAPAWSMDYGAVYQSAEIVEATLSPPGEDGTSTLRFKVTNLTVRNLVILGVKSSGTSKSRIMVELEPEKFIALDSLSIESEEILDMNDAGIFVELGKLHVTPKLGDMVPLKLILMQGELPFTAHVILEPENLSHAN